MVWVIVKKTNVGAEHMANVQCTRRLIAGPRSTIMGCDHYSSEHPELFKCYSWCPAEPAGPNHSMFKISGGTRNLKKTKKKKAHHKQRLFFHCLLKLEFISNT